MGIDGEIEFRMKATVASLRTIAAHAYANMAVKRSLSESPDKKVDAYFIMEDANKDNDIPESILDRIFDSALEIIGRHNNDDVKESVSSFNPAKTRKFQTKNSSFMGMPNTSFSPGDFVDGTWDRIECYEVQSSGVTLLTNGDDYEGYDIRDWFDSFIGHEYPIWIGRCIVSAVWTHD